MADGSCVRTLINGHADGVYSVDVTVDGAHIISSEGREVRIWSFADGSLVRTLTHLACVLRS